MAILNEFAQLLCASWEFAPLPRSDSETTARRIAWRASARNEIPQEPCGTGLWNFSLPYQFPEPTAELGFISPAGNFRLPKSHALVCQKT